MRELACLGILAAACAAGCTYDAFTVTQAGTVPAPRAMMYDGQPLEKSGRIEGRSTTVVTPLGQHEDGSSGNYVARHHSDVAIRGGRGNSEVGMEINLAWVDGSQAASPNLGPRPDATDAFAVKFGGRHSFALGDNGFRLGAGIGMGVLSAPVIISAAETERDEAMIFELALVPSYRKDNLTFFGGLNFTSEAYVPRNVLVSDEFDVPEVSGNRGAVVLSAGASMAFTSGLHLTAQLALPTGSEIARHGVQLDLSIGFDFGRKPRPRPPAQPIYYPPQYPPQPTYPPPGGPAPGGGPTTTPAPVTPPAPTTPAPTTPPPAPTTP